MYEEVLKRGPGWHTGENLSSSDSFTEEKAEGCKWNEEGMDVWWGEWRSEGSVVKPLR